MFASGSISVSASQVKASGTWAAATVRPSSSSARAFCGTGAPSIAAETSFRPRPSSRRSASAGAAGLRRKATLAFTRVAVGWRAKVELDPLGEEGRRPVVAELMVGACVSVRTSPSSATSPVARTLYRPGERRQERPRRRARRPARQAARRTLGADSRSLLRIPARSAQFGGDVSGSLVGGRAHVSGLRRGAVRSLSRKRGGAGVRALRRPGRGLAVQRRDRARPARPARGAAHRPLDRPPRPAPVGGPRRRGRLHRLCDRDGPADDDQPRRPRHRRRAGLPVLQERLGRHRGRAGRPAGARAGGDGPALRLLLARRGTGRRRLRGARRDPARAASSRSTPTCGRRSSPTWTSGASGSALLYPLATLVKISAEDLALLHPGTGAESFAADLVGKGVSLVVVTDGGDAAEGWTATGHHATAVPPKVTVIDTVGAGDTFQAALIAWLLRAAGGPKAGLAALDPDSLRRPARPRGTARPRSPARGAAPTCPALPS